MSTNRELLSSRLGFLLISAGCAIGLGNIWRFPYITGQYGGAAFVLIYLFFLLALGLPVLIMEFSVGRAARINVGKAFKTLEPEGTYWHLYGPVAIFANYVIMMFYTTVTGWILYYTFNSFMGNLAELSPAEVGNLFGSLISSPTEQVFWTLLAICIGSTICAAGVRNGVERVTKFMMAGTFLIMIVLAIRTCTLEGAGEGLKFYLMPDFSKIIEQGLWETVYAAMGQAFFTLSIGIGSMAIFGSYINKDRTLTGEGLSVLGLDTLVALLAGCIIFPACFAFDVSPSAGPGLIFVVLPNVFNSMPAGFIWGTLFFVFMSFAALSTVVAVFENIISYSIDVWGMRRKNASLLNFFLISILSLPCILGFNHWSGFEPLGPGTNILDLEDFIVSNNLLPLGSLFFLFFCITRYGWGWDNFIKEADTGKGVKFPQIIRMYLLYILPAIFIFVFVQGYIDKFYRA